MRSANLREKVRDSRGRGHGDGTKNDGFGGRYVIMPRSSWYADSALSPPPYMITFCRSISMCSADDTATPACRATRVASSRSQRHVWAGSCGACTWRSEWPLRNFVAEWIDTSAPRASGCDGRTRGQ